jgi:hypothetical protein
MRRPCAAAPVVVTSYRDDTAGGDTNNDTNNSGPSIANWQGISFTSTSLNSHLDHTQIRYGADTVDGKYGMINVTGSNLTISNSIITRAAHVGIDVFAGGNLTLTNSLVVNNTGFGIQAEASSTLIAINDTIDGNLRGITLDSPTVILKNDLITNNNQIGISQTGVTNLTLSFTDVFSNGTDYSGLAPQTNLNGNVSVDPKYFNRQGGQYQLRPGSPVEDAGTSSGAPATDFFSNPRFKDPNLVGRGDGSGYDMGPIEVEQTATSNVDLTVGVVTGPTAGAQNQSVTVNWTVQSVGTGTATGTWHDSVYLSPSPLFTADAILLGTVQHTGDLSAGQSYNGTGTFKLPGITPGNYYFLVRANSQNEVFEGSQFANNVTASSQTIATSLPALTLGTATTGTLPGTGNGVLYQVTTVAGTDLNLALVGAAGTTNELYISFGTVPTRQSYDARSVRVGAANQSLSVSNTRAGTYYILVYGANVPSSEQFQLTASTAGFTVGSVSPVQGSNTGKVTLTIDGTDFDSHSHPQLVTSGGITLQPSAVYYTDSGSISATFDLAGTTVGTANVQIVNTGNVTQTLTHGFNIIAGTAGTLTTSISTPSGVRVGRAYPVVISYANTGNTDLLAPILNVTGTNSDPLSFDTDFTNATNSLNLIGANPNGPAGILPPGAHGTITIYASGLTVGANHFQLTIGGYPGTPIDWAGIEPLIHPDGIPDDEWHNFVTLLQANIGDSWDDFAQVISADTTLLPAGLGRNTSLANVFQLEISKVKGQLQPPLSGHVYLGDASHPLGNVAIDIGDPDTGTTFFTTSLSDGSFLIPFVDAGTYEIQIVGFVSATSQLVVGDDGLNNVELVVTEAGTISGRVVNSAGAPLPGLLVTAIGDDNISHLAETAADGTYVIDSLPAGNYEVDAGGDTLSESTISNVAVSSGGRTGNVNLLLQDTATISGTVLGPDGPISGATVSAATDDGIGSSTTTDDSGHYTVTGLSTGIYVLTASAPDLATSEISSLNLAAGTSLNGQNFSLAVGGTVTGQILIAGTATSISDVVLMLTGSAGTFSGVTDANGQFSVTGLPAGNYDLVTLASTFMSVETNVTITAGQTSTANLTTTTLGAVSGEITDSVTHSPLPHVIVQLFDETGFVTSALTDTQGNYEIDGLDAGNYQVVLGDYGSPGVAKANITLSVAQSHATANLTVGLAGSVSGFVFQADGVTPDAGITVALNSLGLPVLFTTTDATGKYVFDVLTGGTFDIIASDVGVAFPARTGVAINGGSQLTGLNFQAGNQVLGGKIVDKNNNQPLAGATVELSYDDPVAGLISIDSVETGSDGSYSLTGAIPGNWQITVTASGHATTTQTVVVPASGPLTANFQLNVESVLSGTVRNATTGSPLANVTLELLSATSAQLVAVGVSDELGHYQIHGLVPGVYRLLTQGDGLQSVLVGNVTVGSASSVLNVGLAASTTIVTGTVSSGIGALGNATVTVLDPQGIIWEFTQTADDGTYSISGLPAGQYTVIATAVGYQSAAPATLSLLNGQSNAQLNLSATPIAITDASTPAGGGSTTTELPLWVVAFSDPDPRTLKQINEDVASKYACPAPTPDTPSAKNVLTAVIQGSNDRLKALVKAWPKFEKYKTDFAQTNQRLAAINGNLLKDAQLAFETYNKATKNSSLGENISDIIRHLGQLQDLLAKIGNGVDDTFDTQLVSLGSALSADLSDLTSQISALIKRNSGEYSDQVLVRNLQKMSADSANLTDNVFRMSNDIGGLEKYETLKRKYDQSLAGVMKGYDELVRSCNCAAANAPGLPYKSPTSLPTDPSNPLYNLFYGSGQVTPHLETPSITPNESLKGIVCIMQPVDPIGKPDPTGVKKDPDNPPDNTDGGGSDVDVEDAFDPNNFTGPSGFGAQGFIQPQIMSYQVDFENDPAKATAAAQIVSTTFTIDPDLDPSTLQFTGFGFGQQNITLPPGLFHYQTTLDLRPQGINLLVPVTLDENRVTGVVTVKFESLDPLTNLPPDGVNAGFLPIDDDAGDGQGYFTYTVQPKAGLPTGTQITEQTSIVFDSNASVQTPIALNTIDVGTPSSTVSSLAAQSNANFTVNWSGTDDTGGSGIASYDIYVSDNGGDYSPWQSATSATSATYMGQGGHTYRFYSVARDNVGHVESAPLTADATTATIFVDSPPVIVNQSFNIAENTAAGVAVGTVVASDPDVPTVLSYSITAGNSANNFTIDPTSNVIKVAAGAILNFEATSTYTLTVQVTDDASPSKSSSATVTIHVTDVNETPVIPASQSFHVSGSAAAGFGIGTVTATDPDATAPNNTKNFSILNGTGTFAINPTTGQISVANAAALTALAGTTVTLQVTDTDGGTPALSATQNVSVIVGPANTAPVLANPGPVSTFIGNVKAPVKIAPTLTVTDADGPTSIASIVISVNLGAVKKNPDITDLPGLGPIGTFMTEIVGGRMQFTITVKPGVTNAAIQTLLENITFQTKGTGLKLTSRSFQIQVTDNTGLHSNTVTQNLVVEKKAPKVPKPPKHPK